MKHLVLPFIVQWCNARKRQFTQDGMSSSFPCNYVPNWTGANYCPSTLTNAKTHRSRSVMINYVRVKRCMIKKVVGTLDY